MAPRRAWSRIAAASCQIVLLALAVTGCGGGGASPAKTAAGTTTIIDRTVSALSVSLPAFGSDGRIPKRFTCSGRGTSPPLRWLGVPAGTRELALVVYDMDAPGGQFMHWTMWGISPRLRSLSAGVVPHGAVQGVNSAGSVGWTPPCPPPGDRPHRYVFTLYALRRPMSLPVGAAPGSVMREVVPRTLAQGATVAHFAR